jgi:tetratricopeptide (TPR) repeat protein
VASFANSLADYSREIKDDRIRCILLAICSSVYEKLCMLEKSELTLQESLICIKNMNEFLKINTLPDIASELVKQGKLEDALIIVEDLSLEVWKGRVLSAIAIQLAHQSQLTQAIFFARGIIDHWWRGFSLKAIACEFAQGGMFKEATFTIRESHGCFILIEDGETKSRALQDLSVDLAKLGYLEEAFDCAQSISIDSDRINAWKAIAIYLAKKGNWQEVEKVISQISITAERHKCLLQIGHFLLTTYGYEVALAQLNLFDHFESRQYLHKGITLALSVNNITPNLARQSLLKSMKELTLQEHILNQTALYQLYFTQIPPKRLQRYRSTLCINWAIDIKDSFSAN